jgi:hypothetical protein
LAQNAGLPCTDIARISGLLITTTQTTGATMYYVCRMTDDFKWIGLRSTTDEAYADQLVEYYSDKYPNAYVDVLDYDDYHRSSVHWP